MEPQTADVGVLVNNQGIPTCSLVLGQKWWRRCVPNAVAGCTTRYGVITRAMTILLVKAGPEDRKEGVPLALAAEVLPDGSFLASVRRVITGVDDK